MSSLRGAPNALSTSRSSTSWALTSSGATEPLFEAFACADGAEQRAIADTLTAQAEETERDEAAARKLLGL